MAIKILNCGQCGFDHQAISAFLKRVDGTCEVLQAHSINETLHAITRNHYDLVLINRIFDQTGEEGIALIKQIRKTTPQKLLTLLLVSNLPEAQEAAIKHGAMPGFGKAQLNDSETMTMLKGYLSCSGDNS